ncbi:DMT family transporter [Labrys sp. KB_33_2]|uniref:EamA family transporter n=1 Tax=Labrys sp. KB_33_2 TaxID=3237479 RepID=UPI003F92DDD1
MRKDLILGIVLVLVGASCYGLQSTCVKLAYGQGYSPGEVIGTQFVIGAIALGLIKLASQMRPSRSGAMPVRWSDRLKLIAGGASIGFTGSFYYLSVAYTSVSAAIVLLMQSVWMGVALDALLTRSWPSPIKLASSALVLLGTVLATNLLGDTDHLSVLGITFGLMAAVSYTAVIWCSNHVAVHVDVISRSFLMVFGGAVVAVLIALPQLSVRFDPSIIWGWGLVIALFGTVLPPFLFNKGIPATGVGLAAMLSSVELPVAVVMAGLMLHEAFLPSQWAGVGIILGAIGLANVGAGRAAA